MRRFAIFSGLIAGFVTIQLFAIPFLLNVDQYRPLLTSALNERITGSADLGRLSLSLWRGPRIRAEGLRIVDSRGRTLVSVKEAEFHIPLISLMIGDPKTEVYLDSPELITEKDSFGKLNALSIWRPVGRDSGSAPVAGSADSVERAGVRLLIPALMLKSRLGLRVRNARVIYRDEFSGRESRFERVGLRLMDITASRPVELEMEAELDSPIGPSGHFNGLIQAKGRGFFFGPEISGLMRVDASALRIEAPGLLSKKSGVPLVADFEFKSSGTDFQISRFQVGVHQASLQGHGSLRGSPTGSELLAEVETNGIDVRLMSELFPFLKPWSLEGFLGLQATIRGPTAHLSVNGKVEARKVSFSHPLLKARPLLEGACKFTHLGVDGCDIQFQSPGSEVRVFGSVPSLIKPEPRMVLKSSGIDFDQLLLPVSRDQSPIPLNLGLIPLRGKVDADIRKVRIRNVDFEELKFSSRFASNQIEVDEFGFKVFNGKVMTHGKVKFSGSPPVISFGCWLKNLDLSHAKGAGWNLLGEEPEGVLNLSAQGTWTGLDSDSFARTLHSRGSFTINQAAFISTDLPRMVDEAIDQSIKRVSRSFLHSRVRRSEARKPRKLRYSTISAHYLINGGRFEAPDFRAVPARPTGVGFVGATTIGLLDQSLRADWMLSDPHDQMGLAGLGLEVKGVQIPHVLADERGAVSLPFVLKGSLSKPHLDPDRTALEWGRVVVRNISRQLADRGSHHLKEALQGNVVELKKRLLGH